VAQLEFDESLANYLDVLYNRRDVVRRRRLVRSIRSPVNAFSTWDAGPGFM